MDVVSHFKRLLQQNRSGEQKGIVSVCASNPIVLTAALRTAKRYNTVALIESTSNQVDQFGGYTGLTPDQFVKKVLTIAKTEKFSGDHILFGGDHLGPNTWQHLPSHEAMDHASDLVAAYIKAGYKKIHLDTGFICRNDPTPLSDTVMADRCARLVKACERENSGVKPLYIIGTEVPTPGGDLDTKGPVLTPPEHVGLVINTYRSAFKKYHISEIWDRVAGLVVQPGIEFSNLNIHHYPAAGNPGLAKRIEFFDNIVYEAHSTDYQAESALKQLVSDHFGILKVGPWLTYTLRECLCLLEAIEIELRPGTPSQFKDHLISTMSEHPVHWQGHYTNDDTLSHQMIYSYFDRARYYLGFPEVKDAIDQLFHNLKEGIPLPLLGQYLPVQHKKLKSGALLNHPHHICVDRICDILELYMTACGYDKKIPEHH
jgi:D-tagatose-1,6-bisphosphate aldolase subunit GatZ/KbaZ